ncbi:MAG: hypothetical protein ACJ0NN_00895 [Thermodesulfobacteriota bacterium]|tara:strand:+ start:109 stop:285 length:177 start_codon:yes stop_codon:yes gene_type:complete
MDNRSINSFDIRIISSSHKDKKITDNDYKEYLESLDDVADNAEEVVIKNDEETVDLSE